MLLFTVKREPPKTSFLSSLLTRHFFYWYHFQILLLFSVLWGRKRIFFPSPVWYASFLFCLLDLPPPPWIVFHPCTLAFILFFIFNSLCFPLSWKVICFAYLFILCSGVFQFLSFSASTTFWLLDLCVRPHSSLCPCLDWFGFDPCPSLKLCVFHLNRSWWTSLFPFKVKTHVGSWFLPCFYYCYYAFFHLIMLKTVVSLQN